jgi:hypothetical protein
MSDRKEWVTVKVPKRARSKANNIAPKGATYADCLVAGAQALASDDGEAPDLEQFGSHETFKTGDGGTGELADELAARIDTPQIDYAMLASKTADELEERMR